MMFATWWIRGMKRHHHHGVVAVVLFTGEVVVDGAGVAEEGEGARAGSHVLIFTPTNKMPTTMIIL
jgi:hypothetical protein